MSMNKFVGQKVFHITRDYSSGAIAVSPYSITIPPSFGSVPTSFKETRTGPGEIIEYIPPSQGQYGIGSFLVLHELRFHSWDVQQCELSTPLTEALAE